MIAKPPHCCLNLLWGLILLTSATTATAKANVSHAGAVTPAHQMTPHMSSPPKKNHSFIEERGFATGDSVVQKEFQSLAGKLFLKDVVDVFHKQNFAADTMRKFDNTLDGHAINELLHNPEHNFDHLVTWFGTKSPEDQEVVLDLLAARLKKDAVSRHILLDYLEAGKAHANDGFRVIAAAVEKKYLTSISTSEMYNVLGLPHIVDDEEFVRQVGRLVWDKFQLIGEKEFSTFMLTKMQERSQDDIMWARLVYKLEMDESVHAPLSGLFDELLQTKPVGPGNCRPIDAIKFLTSPHLSRVYTDAAGTSEHASEAVVNELFTWSKDDLLWARLIYLLQKDDSTLPFSSSVFDHLLQPYVSGDVQCTPSQAVNYLTGPELFQIYDRFHTVNDFDATLLAELLKKSHDEVMWAKVLHMLKNDKSVSAPLSGVLTTLLHSWTMGPSNVAAITNQSPFSVCKDFLMDIKFINLYLYAHYSSKNPNVFLVEKLRERSPDEFVWAQALYALQEDQTAPTSLSGVLDALLHRWIGKPYTAAALVDDHPMLVGAYKLLTKNAITSHNSQKPPSIETTQLLLKALLEQSNDESMWAKFLSKLQQDQVFSIVAAEALDALLLPDNAARLAREFPPSSMVKYLTSYHFLDSLNAARSKGGNADAMLLSHIFAKRSSNQVMWAKVLYIMQTGESEAKSIYANLLKTLLVYWTHDVAGEATLSDLVSKSETYLEGQSFANLVAYARFSSDHPDTFVLQKLRKRLPDDLMWARLLNLVRKKQKLQEQGQEEHDAFFGVLNALFHSWIGKPYDGAASLQDGRKLIRAYNYLTGQKLTKAYKAEAKLDQEKADKAILTHLLDISNDEVMWSKFLSKLQKDSTLRVPLSRVLQTLLKSWKHSH